jgi:hypothetical protein
MKRTAFVIPLLIFGTQLLAQDTAVINQLVKLTQTIQKAVRLDTNLVKKIGVELYLFDLHLNGNMIEKVELTHGSKSVALDSLESRLKRHLTGYEVDLRGIPKRIIVPVYIKNLYHRNSYNDADSAVWKKYGHSDYSILRNVWRMRLFFDTGGIKIKSMRPDAISEEGYIPTEGIISL